MTRVGIVVRAPHEDSSVAGDQVGKGDMSYIKSCPKIAGYNGLERNYPETRKGNLPWNRERMREKVKNS